MSEGTTEKAAFLNAMSEEWGTNLSTETSFRIASFYFSLLQLCLRKQKAHAMVSFSRRGSLPHPLARQH